MDENSNNHWKIDKYLNEMLEPSTQYDGKMDGFPFTNAKEKGTPKKNI